MTVWRLNWTKKKKNVHTHNWCAMIAASNKQHSNNQYTIRKKDNINSGKSFATMMIFISCYGRAMPYLDCKRCIVAMHLLFPFIINDSCTRAMHNNLLIAIYCSIGPMAQMDSWIQRAQHPQHVPYTFVHASKHSPFSLFVIKKEGEEEEEEKN